MPRSANVDEGDVKDTNARGSARNSSDMRRDRLERLWRQEAARARAQAASAGPEKLTQRLRGRCDLIRPS
eukprot:364787-Chlamydomonas_euryale.AAC.18